VEKTLKILQVGKKGQNAGYIWELLYIYTVTKQGLQMNETSTNMYNPMYEFLTKTNSNIQNPNPFQKSLPATTPLHPYPHPTYSTPQTFSPPLNTPSHHYRYPYPGTVS
jgi:hypothetical protein